MAFTLRCQVIAISTLRVVLQKESFEEIDRLAYGARGKAIATCGVRSIHLSWSHFTSYRYALPNKQFPDNSVYYGLVGVGSPPQYFRLVFDTGSPNIWICNAKRSANLFMVENSFDIDNSRTYTDHSKAYRAHYGNYLATGRVASDYVQLDRRPFFTDFAVVDTIQGYVDQLYSIDGIFGLTPRQLNSKFSSTTLDDMVSQGLISQRVFAFVFHRGGVKGTVLFGDVSGDNIPGTVHYVPLHSANSDYWMISFKSGLLTILDTGTFRTHLPAAVVQDLLSKVEVTPQPYGETVDCGAIGAMSTLVFSSEHFEIAWYPWQYVQQAAASNLPADVLLGISFLRHYSTVFDMDKKRVGFGKPVEQQQRVGVHHEDAAVGLTFEVDGSTRLDEGIPVTKRNKTNIADACKFHSVMQCTSCAACLTQYDRIRKREI
ncbi:pepsin A [Clonorchis sinensis]|uniref:Pepsin A n=1 Tax=Clonorchis sinensis TaxID=79923 RepID=G7YLF7_CLOSI|nr:pepsin A [Clonorchis sinensis]